MIQVDVYRRPAALDRSFTVGDARLYPALCELAGRPLEAVTTFILGQVAVARVDLGRAGFAVCEHFG